MTTLKNKALVILAVGLFCAGMLYIPRGLYFLFTSAQDFKMNWEAQRYILRGKNVFDVIDQHYLAEHGKTVPPTSRDSGVEPDLGIPDGAYPPWAYVSGLLFTWPASFPVARIYFGIINVIALMFASAFLWRVGISDGISTALLFLGSFLATSSLCTTLGLGQFGLIYLLLVIAAYDLDRRNYSILAGFLMGVAMSKFTLISPFMLPFVFRRRWKVLATTLSYLAIAGAAVAWQVKTSPFEMLQQMSRAAEGFVLNGYSFVNLFVIVGFSASSAIKLAAIVVILAAALLVFLWRSAETHILLAIAAVAARFWSYHNHYDNCVMFFVMLALGIEAFRKRSRLAFLGFFLMGLSLWLPARISEIASYQIFQCCVWIGCLGVLLSVCAKSPQSAKFNGPVILGQEPVGA